MPWIGISFLGTTKKQTKQQQQQQQQRTGGGLLFCYTYVHTFSPKDEQRGARARRLMIIREEER